MFSPILAFQIFQHYFFSPFTLMYTCYYLSKVALYIVFRSSFFGAYISSPTQNLSSPALSMGGKGKGIFESACVGLKLSTSLHGRRKGGEAPSLEILLRSNTNGGVHGKKWHQFVSNMFFYACTNLRTANYALGGMLR